MDRPVSLVKKNFTCYTLAMKKERERRPTLAGEPQFVRLTDDLLRKVEAHRLAMEGRGEGSTKSDALRDLIGAGLVVRELIDLLPTCDAEPPRGASPSKPRPATKQYAGHRRHCDEHAVAGAIDLPYATVLRKLAAHG